MADDGSAPADPHELPDQDATPRPARRRWLRWVLFGVPTLVVVYVVVTCVQVWHADGWDGTGPADAAVVLGAAQYNGRPSAVLEGRLDHAEDLWRRGVVPRIVLTGGRQVGDRFTEASAGFQYLRRKGVPEADLLIVSDGSNTWESLAASKRVLNREGIRKVLLVSDPYHSFRLIGIAGEIGIDAKVSPTDRSSSTRELLRESASVALGRIIGYRRLVRLVG